MLWQALDAPAGTPAPIVTRLNAEVNAILHDSAAVDALAKLGVEAQPGTAQQLADRIEPTSRKWHDVIVSAGIFNRSSKRMIPKSGYRFSDKIMRPRKSAA